MSKISPLAVLAIIGCCTLSLPYTGLAGESNEPAVIRYTGSGIGFCGVRKDPICEARVSFVDGEKVDYFSSEVRVPPGTHTLRLTCAVQFGVFQGMKHFGVEKAVSIAPGGKYHVQGKIEGEICLASLIDESTDTAMRSGAVEVKASPPGTYPATQYLTMYASTDTVSSWTETPADDHLISHSQIYVSSGSGSGGSTGGVFGGALGAVIGVQIDRAASAKSVASVEDDLRLVFAPELSEAVRQQIAARSNPAKYAEVTEEGKPAQLVLLPSARLAVSADGRASLVFRLAVHIYDLQSGKENKRNFYYPVGKRLAVAGADSWTEGHSKAIVDAAHMALPKLMAALFDDIEGISSTIGPDGGKADMVFREH